MKRHAAQFMRALLLGVCITLLFGSVAAVAQSGQIIAYRHLGAYFEEWSIYGANYNLYDTEHSGAAAKLTHILYAFANVTTDGQCQLADAWADYQDPYLPSVDGSTYPGPLYGNFYNLVQLKKLHPGLKVLISLGGASQANTEGFQASASTAALRQKLAASCINLFIKGNIADGITAPGLFDGIDLDWEFPTAADKTNFTALIQEFRRQLEALSGRGPLHYLLTIAAPAGQQNFSNMELAKIAPSLDFFNLEGYDYHGTWETTTNHAAPLYQSPYDPSKDLTIEFTVSSYLKAGVPGWKLSLGVPSYGRGWAGVPSTNHGLYQSSTGPAPSPQGDSLATDGVATYLTLSTLPGYTLYHDPYAMADWLYNPDANGGEFWTFDDPNTVAIKMNYVMNRVPGGLNGGFMWALKDDDSNATLIKTMGNTLGIKNH
jgi:chitinase